MKALRSLFPNGLLIARREYLVRVRSRAFVFSTLIVALVSLAVVLAPIAIQALSAGSHVRVGVYQAASDLPADTLPALDRSLFGASAGSGDSAGSRREFELLPVTDLDAAKTDVQRGKLNGLLVICRASPDGSVPPPCGSSSISSKPQPDDLVFEYHADVAANGRQAFFVRLAANALAIEDRGSRAGIQLGSLFAPAQLAIVNPKLATGASPGQGGQSRTDEEQVSRMLASTALIVLIFIVVISYGTWVAMSVAEEKSSRVMELMLNAATPIQMLAGKVIGNGLAGFTQYMAILAAGGFGLLIQGPVSRALLGEGSGVSLPFGGLTIPVLLGFGVFFVLGFLLYAVLYAAAGSMVSRQEDVQQAVMPLMMVSMVGYFAATFGLQDIEAPWVGILSFVPFFSPYLMLARLMLSTVPAWEVAVSVMLLVGSIAVALVVAARIYSAGVLLYGQRAGLRKIISAARVAR